MQGLKISSASQEEIALWKNLMRYPAWKRLVSLLEEKVVESDVVINMLGGDSATEFSKRDMAIIKKMAYLDLINFPEQRIELLTGTGEKPIENMDAFDDELEDNSVSTED